MTQIKADQNSEPINSRELPENEIIKRHIVEYREHFTASYKWGEQQKRYIFKL